MTKFLNNVDVTGYISQTSVTSSLLKTDANGKLVAAVAGTDYNAPNVSAVAGTLIREIRNATGATLTKGTVVYISGATGNKATVSKAIATGDSTSAQTFGLCQTDIANNSNGYVVCVGDITGLDTSAFTEGTQLYLSSTTAGTYTSTKQLAPNHLVYIGVVTRSHPTQGQIEVNIQNGYELYELHDVSITSVANNQGLFYEESTDLWKNKSIATVLGYTPANDSAVVHTTGNETINGFKTFSTGANIDMLQISESVGYGNLSGYSQLKANAGFFHFVNGANTNSAKFTYAGARAYTLPSSDGTLALVSQLSGYLPLTGGTLTGGLYINPADTGVVGLDVASNTIRLRSDNVEGFKRQLTTTMSSGTLVKMQAAGYGGTYVTDLGFYTSSNSAVNTTPNLYLTGGDNRVGINTTTPGYTLDVDGTGRYTGALIANSFVKSGGTSAQFLMADGSISLGATAAARTEQIFTATSGQTTFTVTGGYVVGLVDVYVNGVKLLPADFTATNGTTVVLDDGVVLNDSVTIINYTATIAALPTSRDTIDYTATSAQTTFTVSGGYAVGLLDVYVNGVKLTSSEYTATNGTTFVLAVASITGDQVQAIRYNASITGVSGSGTANYVPKFTASQTLGNSLIQDDGTTVTIGSTNSSLLMTRAANTNEALVNFSSGGTTRWNVGLRNTSTDDFSIFNPVLGIPYMTLSATTSLANFGVSVRALGFTSYASSGIFLVNSSGGTNAVHIRINNTGGDLRMGMESSAGGGFQTGTSAYAAVFGNQANNATQFTTNGTVRMTIAADGNVGINTTSTSGTYGKLSVAGGISILNDNNAKLEIGRYSSGASNSYIKLGANSNSLRITNNTDLADLFTITNAGNVGIGTTSPVDYTNYRSLHIMGSASNSSAILYLTNSTSSIRGLFFTEGTANRVTIGSQSNHDFTFLTNDTERMRITSGGNVGIGTSSPSAIGTGYLSLTTNGVNGGGLVMQVNGTPTSYIYAESGSLVINNTSGVMRFYNAGTERMILTSGGYFKASTTGTYINASGAYHEFRTDANDPALYLLNHNGAGEGLLINLNTNGTTYNFLRAYSNSAGANRLIIYTNGNVVNANNSYGAISDIKLKENISDSTPKLADLLKVKVKNFNFIGSDDKQLGVIAQELEEVFPSMIDISPDRDADGNDLGTVTKSVKYSVFVPMLIKAIQELKAELDLLKNK